MMPFHRAPLSFILGWPILILVVCGLAAIGTAIAWGLWWLVQHIAWVS